MYKVRYVPRHAQPKIFKCVQRSRLFEKLLVDWTVWKSIWQGHTAAPFVAPAKGQDSALRQAEGN